MSSRIWKRGFCVVTVVNFFVALSLYLLVVIISLFAMERFESSPAMAGFATGLFVIGSLVARLFTGRRLELVGRKRMIYLGLFLNLLMTVSYFAAGNILVLCGIRVFHGIAFGVITTALGTIVVNEIPEERRGEGLGYFMMSVTLATAVGPFLAMFLRQHGSYSMIFTACTIAAVLALVGMLFFAIPEIQLTPEQRKEMRRIKFSNFFELRAIPISIFCATIYFCYSSVLTFLSAYAKEIDLLDAAGFFFIVYAITVLISRPFVGRLFDSRGENLAMYPSIVIFAGGMILLSQVEHGGMLLLTGILIGLGTGAVQSISQAVTVKVTPIHRMGLATSTFFLCLDIAIGIGPFLSGWFISSIGYRAVYFGAGLISMASIFLYYALHGKKAMLNG